jgi:predicted nuclease of restriction endonuclease-like (RecB) superfamily
VKKSEWGKATIKEFAAFVQSKYVGISGFSASNIWRMRQFYETYCGNKILAPVVRELSWSHNLLILPLESVEKREFYLQVSSKNHYSKRELSRQIDSKLFERTMLSDEKNRLSIAKNQGLSSLRDRYVLEFLGLSDSHKENDLRKAIVDNLKSFLLEFGKDFTFIGDEYRVQVGNSDFFIDLLFYNRDLACLVAIELKIEKFKPEHLGQLEFYLEALDRNVKKPNENPSVGLILCSEKDDEVVEYALSRSMSPALIAEYQIHLPQKALLENKLRELREMVEVGKSIDDGVDVIEE